MAGPEFNEIRFAKGLEYQDRDFSVEQFKVEERAEILDSLREEPKANLDYAIMHLRSEARDFRERFVVRLILHQTFDWLSLDASQRCRYFAFSMKKMHIDDRSTSTPFPWDWGAYLLELMSVVERPLANPFHLLASETLSSGGFSFDKRGEPVRRSSDQKLLPFALEMQAATQGETIDWDSFGIPADRFWLDCARRGLTEPDPARAAQWVHDLCDAHQAAANTQGDTGGTDVLTGNEIDEPSHFLWPITVHAFIRLRRQIGLPDPESVDHPLLRTSFAPLLDTAPGPERWQAEPWFTDIVDICTAQIPALQDAKDLVL